MDGVPDIGPIFPVDFQSDLSMKSFDRIYLVDDDKIFMLTAQFSLKRVFPDAEIQSFKNPEEALAVLKEQQPDLMLLDLNMPVMSGWTFLEELSKSLGITAVNFPIYIVSSSIDPDDSQRARTNPLVKGFIEKPLDVGKVREISRDDSAE